MFDCITDLSLIFKKLLLDKTAMGETLVCDLIFSPLESCESVLYCLSVRALLKGKRHLQCTSVTDPRTSLSSEKVSVVTLHEQCHHSLHSAPAQPPDKWRRYCNFI